MVAGGPEAGTFEQHDQRHPVAHCEFGQAVALGIAARRDGAGQRREILRTDHHRPAVDESGAGHDRIGGDLATHHRAELLERPGIEQVLDPGPSIQLALAVMSGHPIGATHLPHSRTAPFEVGECFSPGLGVGHQRVLVDRPPVRRFGPPTEFGAMCMLMPAGQLSE